MKVWRGRGEEVDYLAVVGGGVMCRQVSLL